MSQQILLAAPGALDSDTHAFVLLGFLAFIVPILFVCVLSGPERDRVNEFYTAGRRLKPLRGALVLSGVYLPTAAVLGNTGGVAVFGYDGLFMTLCTALSLGVLLLLARPCASAPVTPWATRSPCVLQGRGRASLPPS